VLVLVDNNFADRDGMRKYLAASPANRAAISETVLEEWFKAKAGETTQRVQTVACEFPKQILVLRRTTDLLHVGGGSSSILLRLIDRQQTRDFPAYCDTVVNAPMTPELEARFLAHRQDVQDTFTGLTQEAHKLMRRFAAWDVEFANEQRQLSGLLQRDVKLPGHLQRALLEKAYTMGGNLFAAHKVAREKVPTSHREAINLLAVRYGVMAVALYIVMRNRPGTYPQSDAKVLNHLNDLKIAAQASYFDGFLTHEAGLEITFQVGANLIAALGGYSGSGKAGKPPLLASNLDDWLTKA
jgi:hypothetical protein